MRWTHRAGMLALVMAVVALGCSQRCFMTEADYQHYRDMAGVPKDLDTNPVHACDTPSLAGKTVPAPTTVIEPEREPRYITLAECFALALENGDIGDGYTGEFGPQRLSAPGFNGLRGNGAITAGFSTSIRALSLMPAIYGTDIERSLSRFDVQWRTSMSWNTTDEPVVSGFQQAVGGLPALRSQDAQFATQLFKNLPTGGVSAITFTTDYQYSNFQERINPNLNPFYRPALQFGIDQPLLRGYGVEFNQITDTLPGGTIPNRSQFWQSFPGYANGNVEGILISRIRYDQSRKELERNVQLLLHNVEVAYWNLYTAFGQLFARQIAVRNNLEVWRVTRIRVEAGQKGNTQAELFSAIGQYEQSRADWVAALNQVLERERNLRGLLGLPLEDGQRLVPADAPTMAPYQPDWDTALIDALTLRPELLLAREQIGINQLRLIEFKNGLLPDLRAFATYDINAVGNQLGGSAPLTGSTLGLSENAFRNLADDRFNNWAIGLRLTVPIGYRDANALLRAHRLRLAQAYWTLRDDENRVSHDVAQQYRRLFDAQRQIQLYRSSVDAFNNELNVRRELERSGTALAVDVTLQTIRFGTQSLLGYYQAIGDYNNALVSFERAKGTLLQRNNISIAEGPLPKCAAVRAVEHEREKSKAIALRERAAPCPPTPENPGGLTPLPTQAPSLTDLLRSQPPLPADALQGLPAPRPLGAPAATGGESLPTPGTLPGGMPGMPAGLAPAVSPNASGAARELTLPSASADPAALPRGLPTLSGVPASPLGSR